MADRASTAEDDYPIGPYGQKWAEKFVKYDAANPQVWELFKRFTFEMVKAGHDHLSAILILYRIRYETMISTVGDDFKINCAYGPSYARKFMREYPWHRDLFECRVREVLAGMEG